MVDRTIQEHEESRALEPSWRDSMSIELVVLEVAAEGASLRRNSVWLPKSDAGRVVPGALGLLE